MKQARQGALDAFLAEVECRALRMAEISTRDRDEALDLVQDAMLQFVQRYRHKPAQEWKPLFYRILENRLLDWHRQRKSRGRWWVKLFQADADEDPLEQIAAGPASNPLHAVQRGHSMSRLESALAALPQRQRQVFLLRVWEGLDVAATARAMRVSQGSVKTHLSRALARLKTALGEEWP